MDCAHFIVKNLHLFQCLNLSRFSIALDVVCGGDVVGFLKKIENIDFKEAIEILADRSNITLPKVELRRRRTEKVTFEGEGI